MHLVIGYRVTQLIEIDNISDFLYGSVAIDWVKDKNNSHFYSGDTSKYTRVIDYNQFFQSTFYDNSDFMKGCYGHLIADDLWLQGFYLPWMRAVEHFINPEMDHHKDFKILNTKLNNYYNVKTILELLNTFEYDLKNVSNIELGNMNSLRNQLKMDVSEQEDGELSVFHLHQILGYIETSAHKIAYLLSEQEHKKKIE